MESRFVAGFEDRILHEIGVEEVVPDEEPNLSEFGTNIVGIVPNDVQGKGLGDSVFDGEIGHGPIDFVVELQCPNCGLLNTVPIAQMNQKRTEIGSF